MNDPALNLDQIAAARAQAMVAQAQEQNVKKPLDTLERLVTKTLGVLQEQGVYAGMLFLFSRSSDEARVAPVIRAQLFQALQTLPQFASEQIEDQASTALRFYTDQVLEDLDTLLLVRNLYEQTLIYARYGAKAAGG